MAIFGGKKPQDEAHALYVAIVGQARQPVLFEDFGVPDSVDGRFDMISLHIFLVLRRLKADVDKTADLAQCLFDTMFADMDRSLREMGAGDLGVGRRVKAMATAFYGRLSAYEKAMQSNDRTVLRDAVVRNIFRDDAKKIGEAEMIADYVLWLAPSLEAWPIDDLLMGKIDFPPPEASKIIGGGR
jgi:cytochrome b pre-mRNA-processing protein 3